MLLPEVPAPRSAAEIQGLRDGGAPGAVGVFPPPEQRLLRLMAEFRRRQRERPDMVVRPWLSEVPEDCPDPGIGFVVEYCPTGGDIAELRVRHDRAVAEGPAGSREAALCLRVGWRFDGADVRGAELMANRLSSMLAPGASRRCARRRLLLNWSGFSPI